MSESKYIKPGTSIRARLPAAFARRIWRPWSLYWCFIRFAAGMVISNKPIRKAFFDTSNFFYK